MNEYARASGRESAPHPNPLPASGAREVPRKPLRALTECEKTISARRRALVHEHMPEVVPQIRALVEAGLIDGWRNVGRVEVFATGEVA